VGWGLLRLGLDDVGDAEVGEAYGMGFGVWDLFVELFGGEEVEFLELLLRLILLHINICDIDSAGLVMMG
jgi:hypothetical protein